MGNIAIIPARSGSKGLKDKNIKKLLGKPLLAYSIEAAKKSEKFDEIFVSTDSKLYAVIAQEYGANASFLRSPKTSSDTADSWSVVREVIEKFEEKGKKYNTIMLLQPTSPLRTEEDICNSFQLMEQKKANAILSVTEVEHSPLWCNTLDQEMCMDHFQNNKYKDYPRQFLPKFYRLNGAIYLLKTEELYKQKMFTDKCFAYLMPNERSVDIDTEMDFKFAELYLKERGKK